MRQINQIVEEMKAGACRELLRDIYVDEGVIGYQEERYVRALGEYVKIFGEQEVEIYSAPGRSEVGGNHTDHQHGMVLATSINLDAIAIVNKNEDSSVNVYSDGYGMIELCADELEKRPEEESTSAGLIRGVLAGLSERGYKAGCETS